jgi:hypothetical protein
MDTRRERRPVRGDPFQRLEQIIDTFVSLNREAGSLIDKYIDGLEFEDADQRTASCKQNN